MSSHPVVGLGELVVEGGSRAGKAGKPCVVSRLLVTNDTLRIPELWGLHVRANLPATQAFAWLLIHMKPWRELGNCPIHNHAPDLYIKELCA